MIEAGGSQVTEQSGFGTHSHAATNDGRTVTWKTGVLNEITWAFTPNSDGNTAQVTAKSPLGVNGSSTFKRGGTPPTLKIQNEKPAAFSAPAKAGSNVKQIGMPTARPVPGKPGPVYNPFDPNSQQILDVTGKQSGTRAEDPYTGQLFIVP